MNRSQASSERIIKQKVWVHGGWEIAYLEHLYESIQASNNLCYFGVFAEAVQFFFPSVKFSFIFNILDSVT